MRWKRRLTHAAFETVLNVLRALPEWCIKQTVEAYLNRGPAKKLAKREAFLLSRDNFPRHKLRAARQCIEYFKPNEAGIKAENWEILKKGKVPSTRKCIPHSKAVAVVQA